MMQICVMYVEDLGGMQKDGQMMSEIIACMGHWATVNVKLRFAYVKNVGPNLKNQK